MKPKSIKKLRKQKEKQVAESTSLMLNKPDKCHICKAKFDEKSREDHMTWAVAVNEAEHKVFIYCPKCKEGAKKLYEALAEP
jgi:uncharacterized protein with PIN domain